MVWDVLLSKGWSCKLHCVTTSQLPVHTRCLSHPHRGVFLSLIIRSMASSSREVIFLLSFDDTPPGLLWPELGLMTYEAHGPV